MPYLLQADNRQIDYGLIKALAQIMDESPDLTFADATRQLQRAHGILQVESKAEADRLSTRFAEAGFANFVLGQLLEVPAPEPLDIKVALAQGPEIIAMGRLELVTEKTEKHWSPLNMHYSSHGVGLLDDATDRYRVEERDTRYYLDLLTRTRHWQVHPHTVRPHLELLKQLDTTRATLNVSVQHLLAGNLNLLHFRSEEEYSRHLSWLYHLRYAHP